MSGGGVRGRGVSVAISAVGPVGLVVSGTVDGVGGWIDSVGSGVVGVVGVGVGGMTGVEFVQLRSGME